MPKEICQICKKEKDGVRKRIVRGATDKESRHVVRTCRPCAKDSRFIKHTGKRPK